MSNIFSLMDFVPVYKYSDKQLLKEISTDTVDSEWLNKLEENGKIGEDLVKKFLETKYHAIVKKQSDYKGYDFEVLIGKKTIAVEVKSSSSKLNEFYMSYNEMKKAQELGKSYYIYFVQLDKKGNNLFVMQDPYKIFDIENYINIFSSNEIVMPKIESIRFLIKDFSKFLFMKNFDKYS